GGGRSLVKSPVLGAPCRPTGALLRPLGRSAEFGCRRIIFFRFLSRSSGRGVYRGPQHGPDAHRREVIYKKGAIMRKLVLLSSLLVLFGSGIVLAANFYVAGAPYE